MSTDITVNKASCFEVFLKLMPYSLLILAVLTVYAQVHNFEFINFDDTTFVTQNPFVNQGLTEKGIKRIFTNPDYLCMQLSFLSHMIDCELFGMDAGRHHIVNMLFHLFNSLLLYLLLYRMTGLSWHSFLATLLFAIHPLNIESVAWVAERRNVLSTFFWFGALLAYDNWIRRPGFLRYMAIVILFILGLLAKSMLVTLPFMLLLIDYWPLKRISIKNGRLLQTVIHALVEKTPLFAISIISCVLTMISAVGSGTAGIGGLASLENVPMQMRIGNAFISYSKYILRVFWPFDLSIYYPYPRIIPYWQMIGAVFFLLCISLIAINYISKFQWFITGWLWYIGTLVPVIGIVQLGSYEMADRYAYVPVIGIFIIIVWGAFQILRSCLVGRIGITIFTIIFIALLIINAWLHVKLWRNSYSVFNHAVKVTRNNCIAHNNLGAALTESNMPKQALYHFSEALKIDPAFSPAYFNIGMAMEKLGNTDEAILNYRKAIKIDPNYDMAYFNMGLLFAQQQQFQPAIDNLIKSTLINPNLAEAYNNLGTLFEKTGMLKDAMTNYTMALTVKSNFAEAHNNMGALLCKLQKTADAQKHFESAITIKPEFAEAHNNYGNLLFDKKMFTKAILHFSEALKIKPNYADAHNNIAIAYNQIKNRELALLHLKKAIAIAPDRTDFKKNVENILTYQPD